MKGAVAVVPVGFALVASLTIGARLLDGASITHEIDVVAPFQSSLISPGAEYGSAVAVDGDVILVGSPDREEVLAMVWNGTSWVVQQLVQVQTWISSSSRFGEALDVAGGLLVVGAPETTGSFNSEGAAYVYSRIGDHWMLESQLRSAEVRGGERFGAAVAVFGESIAVAAPTGTTPVASLAGDIEIFVRSEQGWLSTGHLFDPDGEFFDGFGCCLAFAGSEDLLIVGVCSVDVGPVEQAGAVMVFKRDAGAWSRIQTITSPLPTDPGGWGRVLVASSERLVIGAPLQSAGGVAEAGAAWVYSRAGDSWVGGEQLAAVVPGTSDQFGGALALAGEFVLVGASRKAVSEIDYAGTVYAFSAVGGSWYQVDEITAPVPHDRDFFGQAIAADADGAVFAVPRLDGERGLDAGGAFAAGRVGLEWPVSYELPIAGIPWQGSFGSGIAGVGDWVLVGNPNEQSSPGVTTGVVYVLTAGSDGWMVVDRILAPDATDDDGAFGSALAMDGTLAAVGEPFDDSFVNDETGSVYILRHDDRDEWTVVQKIVAPDAARLDHFGVALDIEGDLLVIGAPDADSGDDQNAGRLYFYRYVDGWFTFESTGETGDPILGGALGTSVAITSGGVLGGAPRASNGAETTGAVYVFSEFGGTWFETDKLVPGDASAGDEVGRSIASAGGEAMIGVPGKDSDTVMNSGAVDIYTYDGATWSPGERLLSMRPDVDLGFGTAVTTDGSLLVIGAPAALPGDTQSGGRAIVFIRSGGLWVESTVLELGGPERYDALGTGAVLAMGSILVASPGLDVDGVPGSGGVAVFQSPVIFSDGFESAGTSLWPSIVSVHDDRPTQVTVVAGTPDQPTFDQVLVETWVLIDHALPVSGHLDVVPFAE